MFATAVILFREVLEASLIIAIVLGATRALGAGRRGGGISGRLMGGFAGYHGVRIFFG